MDTTYGINDHNAWNPKWDDSNIIMALLIAVGIIALALYLL